LKYRHKMYSICPTFVWRPAQAVAAVEHWPLTTLRDKLIKIGAKAMRQHSGITFHTGTATRAHSGDCDRPFQVIATTSSDRRRSRPTRPPSGGCVGVLAGVAAG
jgi:hypothetical protein